MAARVLVFSNHAPTAEAIGEALRGPDGYEIVIVSSAATGLARIGAESVDCVVLDDSLADCSARDLLQRIQVHRADLPVIVLVATDAANTPAAASRGVVGIAKGEDFAERLIVTVRQLVGRGERARATRRLAHGVFVGRDAERTSLVHAVDRCLTGRGGVFLIEGEAGIGKTTLGQHMATYAETRDMRVLWGRCHHQEGAPPYWLWIQVLRAALQDGAAEQLQSAAGLAGASLAQLIPDVADGRGAPAWPAAGSDEPTLFQFFDGLTSFLIKQARCRPTLIVLDDIHWADRSSLLLLQFLGRELGNASVLVICAYRHGEITDNDVARDTVAALRRESGSLRLEGLSMPEVGELLSLVSDQSVPESFVQAIYRQTDGNPFFVEETLRLLLDEGILYHDGRRWTTRTSLQEIPLPAGAYELLARRLANVSESCRHTLAIAALIGRQFEAAAVAHLAGQPVDAIGEIIDEAVEARLLTRAVRPIGSCSFRQALVQSFLRGSLPTAVRADLHRRYGEYVESTHSSELGLHVAALAHHFLRASDPGSRTKAHHYAMRAARRAENLLAHEQAARHYETALDALPPTGDTETVVRLDMLLKASECWWRAGESIQARRVAIVAAEVSHESGRAEDFAHAALAYAGQQQGFGAVACDHNVVRILEEALDLLGPGESGLHARLLGRLAEEITFSDEHSRRDEMVRQSVEIARRSGDRSALAAVLTNMHWALWTPEKIERRLELANEILDLAKDARDPAMKFEGHLYRCLAMLELADIAAVHKELEKCARLALDLRQPYNHWLVASTRVCVALAEGRLAEVAGLAGSAHELGEKAQSPNAALFYGVQLSHLCWLRGDFQQRLQIARRNGENHPLLASTLHAVRAQTLAAQGMRDAARSEFECIAADDFARLPRNVASAMSLAYLAEACAFLGDARRAAQLHQMLLPFQHRLIVLVPIACYGPASHYLGLLSATMGDAGGARRHFEDAIELSTRLGMNQFLARTQVAYAELLLDQGDSGSQPRELIERSQAMCKALDMPVLAERARMLHERCALQPNGARRGRDVGMNGRVTADPQGARCGDPLIPRETVIQLRCEGRYFTFIRGDQISRLGKVKGASYLRCLLRQPDVEFHVDVLWQLVNGQVLDSTTGAGVNGDGPDSLNVVGFDEPCWDDTACREMKAEHARLTEEIARARANNDVHQEAHLRARLKELEGYAVEAYRGTASGPSNKRRIAIWKAFSRLYKALAPIDPFLEDHLHRQVTTGFHCVYKTDPYHPVVWEII